MSDAVKTKTSPDAAKLYIFLNFDAQKKTYRYKMVHIFERKVNYYETDKMGITHHSNYIRMEEARVCPFKKSVFYSDNKDICGF